MMTFQEALAEFAGMLLLAGGLVAFEVVLLAVLLAAVRRETKESLDDDRS